MKKQVDPKQLETMVRELKERAAAHRDYIGGHETRTRVMLIDPLLLALGWDPENPGEVQLEFKLSVGFADYVLMRNGEPIVVVEAKKLGTRLDMRNPGQVIKYTTDPAFTDKEMVGFTNGVQWVFFRASKNWEPESVDLASDQTFETAYDLVECLAASKFDSEPPRNESGLRGSVVLQVESQATPLPDADWKKKPARLRFGDGSERETPSWRRVWAESASYVIDRGLVKAGDYPVVLARGGSVKKCALNTSPVHLHGREFDDPIEIRDGIWLEQHIQSSTKRKEYSIRMLERFGIDPTTVLIEYDTEIIASTDSPPPPVNTGRAK